MRILGITLPDNKKVEFALQTLYGIGKTRSKEILATAKVSPDKKAGEITGAEENKLREIVEKYTLEGDLKREVSANIKRLKDIKAYRGTRHTRGLPVRGQRTKTNTRTRRGNVRKTMGSGRKAVEKK
jgi:small subunit ribosomal protein S13